MNKNSSRKWLCAAVALAALLYSGLLFLIKPALDVSAWILYGFTIAAFLLLMVQLAFGSGGVKSYPMLDHVSSAVTGLYVAVQVIVGGIVLMFFDGLPLTLVVFGEALVLGAYLLYVFLFSAVSSHVEAQDAAVDVKLSNIRSVVAQLEMLAAAQSDAAMKKKLSDAAKELRFQDVMTPPELASMDVHIKLCVDELRVALENGFGDADELLVKLNKILVERKQKSRALKR